jgi:hypothetical protein
MEYVLSGKFIAHCSSFHHILSKITITQIFHSKIIRTLDTTHGWLLGMLMEYNLHTFPYNCFFSVLCDVVHSLSILPFILVEYTLPNQLRDVCMCLCVFLYTKNIYTNQQFEKNWYNGSLTNMKLRKKEKNCI